MNYDAIVIGAGHNGLVSALRLADKGWKVLVLEKADLAGGASKSGYLTEPGFTHDFYAMNIGLFLGSEFYQKYGEEMQQHGFEPVMNPHAYASVFPDGTGIGSHTDGEKMRANIAAHSEADVEGWDRMNDYFDKTSPEFLPLMQMELPSRQALSQVYKAWRHLSFNGLVEMGSQLLKSPREFLDYYFENEKVKSMFIPWGFHLDFAPDVSNGAVFPFIESIMNQRNGMVISKGGIQVMINSIVKMIEARGGEVRLNSKVAQVEVENGEARGVVLEDGSRIGAKKAVIGNVTPLQLVNRLVPEKELPQKYLHKAERYTHGPGTMMIHLALDAPLEWAAGETYKKYLYVHIGPYVEDLARTYTQAMNGELPDSPLLVVAQPETSDPGRTPAGKHTLWIQVRALPAEVKKDSMNELEPAHWDELKEAYADRVIDKLAEYAPNVKEVVRARVVLSPIDIERDNANLKGGDSIGGSHHLFQNYLFRPMPSYSRYGTPIKNLYAVGASTWPGGGLNATSGMLLANKLK